MVKPRTPRSEIAIEISLLFVVLNALFDDGIARVLAVVGLCLSVAAAIGLRIMERRQ